MCCGQGGEGATEVGEVPAESHPQEEGGRGEKGTRQTDKSERILSCDTEETGNMTQIMKMSVCLHLSVHYNLVCVCV